MAKRYSNDGNVYLPTILWYMPTTPTTTRTLNSFILRTWIIMCEWSVAFPLPKTIIATLARATAADAAVAVAVAIAAATAAAILPSLASMVIKVFKGCLLCLFLCSLLMKAFLTLLPLPPLFFLLLKVLFVQALVHGVKLSHQHHGHVCRHATQGIVLALD